MKGAAAQGHGHKEKYLHSSALCISGGGRNSQWLMVTELTGDRVESVLQD